MKKSIAIVISFAILFCLVSVNATEPIITIINPSGEIETFYPDFQNSYWGMTYEEVLEAEGNITWNGQMDLGSISVYYYLTYTAGMESLISFFFNNGELQRGVITFLEDHSNDNLYIEDYNTIKRKLIEKYGNETEGGMIWRDDFYKDNTSRYGIAVSIGDLVYLANWETETTKIALQLSGDNYDSSLYIMYEDVNNPYNPNDTGESGL